MYVLNSSERRREERLVKACTLIYIKVEERVDSFQHKIVIDHIPKLITNKDMLNELIPNIGNRLDFINKYEMFISNKKIT
ncbi:hypothetical protein PUN28_009733 [Cardiocondyla obscurior]|uniref:Uncharacterized protein n=1 Tax=Cardiocondyla obscurior TaxID=286306 RepID=A0AAW2FNS1_9HYME